MPSKIDDQIFSFNERKTEILLKQMGKDITTIAKRVDTLDRDRLDLWKIVNELCDVIKELKRK